MTLDDPENAGRFTSEVARAITLFSPDRIILTEPGEYRVRAAMDEWRQVLNVDVEIRDDDRFLCTHD